MRWFVTLLMAASLYGGWAWWHDRPVTTAAGVLAYTAPVQADLNPPARIESHGHVMVERARYDLTVRLLRKERYRADATADIAPYDLAVGWGPMSDARILDQLDISQSGRFFYWRMRDYATFPLAPADLVVSAGQIHAIPATPTIQQQLSKLRAGQVVTLHGYLVDVQMPGGTWSTSLTRTDTGAGACEIMWIEALEVG